MVLPLPERPTIPMRSPGLMRPAVLAQVAMAVILIVYVALGVQSFIAARRARMGR